MKVELKASIISAKLVERNKYTWEPYEQQHEKVYLLEYAPNEVSDQTAHSRSLIRVFVVRMKKLCILGYPKCAQGRFRSVCANAQADLNLRWAHISEDRFSEVTAHMWPAKRKCLRTDAGSAVSNEPAHLHSLMRTFAVLPNYYILWNILIDGHIGF